MITAKRAREESEKNKTANKIDEINKLIDKISYEIREATLRGEVSTVLNDGIYNRFFHFNCLSEKEINEVCSFFENLGYNFLYGSSDRSYIITVKW